MRKEGVTSRSLEGVAVGQRLVHSVIVVCGGVLLLGARKPARQSGDSDRGTQTISVTQSPRERGG